MSDKGLDGRSVDWSDLALYRDKIRKRYHDVWDIPLVKKRAKLFSAYLRDGQKVLDVGAGSKSVRDDISKCGIKVDYRSMDVDRGNPHDYYSLDDVREEFDVVILFEVIEHMPVEEGLRLLRRIREITREEGLILLSAPNVFNPSRHMQDMSHLTFFPYYDLCWLVTASGFDVLEVFRSYNDAFHRYAIKVYLCKALFRFLSIDYAYSIFVVGRKPRAAIENM